MTWPALPLDAWRPTRETLHRYAQIVGKIQLALTPVVNHYWNVMLRVTARGLATAVLRHDGRSFDIELDLVEHRVVVRTSDAQQRTLELAPRAVADFYRELLDALAAVGVAVAINDRPVEIMTELIPYAEDRQHAAYDRDYATRFQHALCSAAAVFEDFRARFLGKCSPVGFFWGTFDLAVARYSGKRITDPPPAKTRMEREGYSHEVSEVGFWPGDTRYPQPAFYALHYPAPEGFATAAIAPAEAHWEAASNCFVLPYEQIREHDPAAKALAFCQSTYDAGARLAGWNRSELERG